MLYALLVAINAYRPPLNELQGCLADLDAFEGLLTRRTRGKGIEIRRLRDSEATREGIIGAFRSHLGRAGRGDHAIFYYSGHGSQEQLPPALAYLEPEDSGLAETLVCYDSRHGDVPDLADPELRQLVAEIAANGPEVVLIADSCHSDGISRDVEDPEVVERRVPAQRTPRPIDAFMEAVQRLARPAPGAGAVRAASAGAASGAREFWPGGAPEAGTGAPKPGSGAPEPRSGVPRDADAGASVRHVAIAACEPHQLSKELPINGARRGAFTVALERALSPAATTATYRQVVAAAAAMVHDLVADQDPRLYVEGDASPDAPFLGGQVGRSEPSMNHEAGAWWLDAGAVDGMLPPGPGGAVELTLVSSSDPPQAVGTASVAAVEPGRARLIVTWAPGVTPDEAAQYRATVARRPTGPVRVGARGDAPFVAAARVALDRPPSVVVVDAGGVSGPDLLVSQVGGDVVVGRPDGTSLAVAGGAPDQALARARTAIEHVSRWQAFRDRSNPGSQLARSLRIELRPLGADDASASGGAAAAPPAQVAPTPVGAGLSLEYQSSDPTLGSARALVRLTNAGTRRLECGLVDLSDRFASGVLAQPAWIEPGGALERRIRFSVPAGRRPAAGPAEARDTLVVVVSVDAFDLDGWQLPPLVDGDGSILDPRTEMPARRMRNGTSGRLALRVTGQPF